MINKNYTKTGKKCRVTFKLTAEQLADAQKVNLLGDFNGWSPEATPLAARKDGSFSTTQSLRTGSEYRFRYLVDGKRWMSDDGADGLVPNRFGDLDSIVALPREE